MIDVRKHVKEDGFCASWLDYCAAFEFPEAYGLFSLLAVTACAVDGRLLINPDSEPEVQPNAFIVLFGPAGCRKGTAIRKALKLLAEYVPDAPMLPMSFTMEALISLLKDDSQKKDRATGLIVAEEFARLIGGPEYQRSNAHFLTEMWDARPVWNRITQAHGYEEIQNPYLSLLGSTSPKWLQDVDSSILSEGFLRRLLLIVEYARRSGKSHPYGDEELFHEIGIAFAERVGLHKWKHTRMELSDSAIDAMGKWYNGPVDQILNSADERCAQFASCMQAHALKIAALIQILEGGRRDLLSEESWRVGAGLIEAITKPMFQAYGSLVPTPFARLRAVILRTVHGAGSEGLKQIEVWRRVADASGAKPKEVAEALQSLLADGTLREKGGRVVG